MENEADKAFSFWQLINRYKIEIPIIQRDYAQGRDDAKARDIRKQLITNMIGALTENKRLTFDFIYGRVSDGTFVPVDGQQRLTTLFLFHLYLFKVCQKSSPDCSKEACVSIQSALKKFTYATRQSSREFCVKIVEKEIIPSTNKNDKVTGSQSIETESPQKPTIETFVKDQAWFYPDWASDPTVAGMLRTLDEIHTQMEGKESTELLRALLSDTSPITFQYLDIGEHGLTDDLYLKMNARGLPLTAWENFKAKLEQWIKESSNNQVWVDNSFSQKLDGCWLDAFWTQYFNEKSPAKPEQQMLSVFRRHLLNAGMLLRKPADGQTDDITQLMAPADSDQFIPFSTYKKVLDLDRDGLNKTLKPILCLFDFLIEKNSFFALNSTPLWDKDGKKESWELEEKEETYKSRVLFHAVMKCFGVPVTNTTDFQSKYKKWMRMVWNILEDTSVNNENYASALALIDKLGENWHEILEWLANQNPEIASWAQEQVKEEIEKAKLLIADFKQWETPIENAEAHSLFKGSLRFLMHGKKWKDSFKGRLSRADEHFEGNRKLLFRAFVSRFTQWEQLLHGLKYSSSDADWRWLLRKSVDDQTWDNPLYTVIDNGKIDNNWLTSSSGLRTWDDKSNADWEMKCKTAHEVLFQSTVIGNCEHSSVLQYKDTNYMLLPNSCWADYKKIILDRRQIDLPKLDDALKCPFRGLHTPFTRQGQRYVWWRDACIYAWDKVANSRDENEKYKINELGELIKCSEADSLPHDDLQQEEPLPQPPLESQP